MTHWLEQFEQSPQTNLFLPRTPLRTRNPSLLSPAICPLCHQPHGGGNQSDDHSPSADDKVRWKQYWMNKGWHWRTEPEISPCRQYELSQRRLIQPDIDKGVYPFRGIRLNRADVEWLLATHENGCGPVDWSDQSQHERQGLDLRGTNLSESDLAELPLARLIGGFRYDELSFATEEKKKLTGVILTRADLRGAHLEGANLGGAQLKGVLLGGAQLQRAYLWQAKLEEADLARACLAGADLFGVQLEKADLGGAQLEGVRLNYARLVRTDLTNAQLDGTILADATLADNSHIGPCLADIRWGNIDLTTVDWSEVAYLGDEQKARQQYSTFGLWKSAYERLNGHKAAVRANRQLSVALQNQGLNEDAARFAYRAQVQQKEVYRFQMIQDGLTLRQRARVLGNWLFSWFLFLLAGYGYKPLRSFLAYLLVIAGFAIAYYLLGLHDVVGPHHLPGPHLLSWYEAIVVSMTAFHGRGFFTGTFSPGDPQALVAAIEAFLGLLIEVTFIATLTQRLFSR